MLCTIRVTGTAGKSRRVQETAESVEPDALFHTDEDASRPEVIDRESGAVQPIQSALREIQERPASIERSGPQAVMA
jgi:hypothetical protein